MDGASNFLEIQKLFQKFINIKFKQTIYIIDYKYK